jgi:hypothetical protein
MSALTDVLHKVVNLLGGVDHPIHEEIDALDKPEEKPEETAPEVEAPSATE